MARSLIQYHTRIYKLPFAYGMQEVLPSESSCDAKADNISGNTRNSKDKSVWFETLWQSGNKYFPTIYSVTSSLKEVKGGHTN